MLKTEKREIENVLIDVDDTITCMGTNIADGDKSCLVILTDMLQEKLSISKGEAIELVRKNGNPETQCLFTFVEKTGISKKNFWDKLRDSYKDHFSVADDAKKFIIYLKKKGIDLYSATTNSRMITLLKLSYGGLAEFDNSPYFKGYFGGDSFGDPNGKFSDNFFPEILKAGDFNPEKTLMIGDNMAWDVEASLKAGIKNVVRITRSQKSGIIERTIENKPYIEINSLELLIK